MGATMLARKGWVPELFPPAGSRRPTRPRPSPNRARCAACGRWHFPVTKGLPDYWQALPERQCPAREAVPKVIDSRVLRSVRFRIASQRLLRLLRRAFGFAPETTQGLQGRRGRLASTPPRRRRERDGACDRLRTAQPEPAGLQIHVLPARRQDLVAPAAGEHQQTKRRYDTATGHAGRLVGVPEQRPVFRVLDQKQLGEDRTCFSRA